MTDHMEAPEVVRLAGVASPVSTEIKEVELGEAQKAELDKMASDMEQWRLERELEIERFVSPCSYPALKLTTGSVNAN